MNGWLTVLCFVLVCGAYVWRGYFDYQKRKSELDAELERMKLRNELENERFQALTEAFNIASNNIIDTFLQTKRPPK